MVRPHTRIHSLQIPLFFSDYLFGFALHSQVAPSTTYFVVASRLLAATRMECTYFDIFEGFSSTDAYSLSAQHFLSILFVFNGGCGMWCDCIENDTYNKIQSNNATICSINRMPFKK